MEPLKKFVGDHLIDLYFYRSTYYTDNNAQHWILPAVYLINFIQINSYVSFALLGGAILHKIYTDAYLTDRLLSIGIFVVALLLNLHQKTVLGLIMFIFIIRDTIDYHHRIKERKIHQDYFTVTKLLSTVHVDDKYEEEFDINKGDDDDEDEDDSDVSSSW